MEVIAVAAAEAKAVVEKRAAGAPPKRPPGRPRKAPLLGAVPPLPAALPQHGASIKDGAALGAWRC